jgi:hypothetical protein
MSDVRLPLLYKSLAEGGEPGAGVEHLKDVAHRLRNDPRPDELEEAASLLERAAAAGPDGAAEALHLKKAHRPTTRMRNVEVWREVENLIHEGLRPVDAYKQIGKKFGLSPSRVKSIYTSHEAAERAARAEWQD